MRGKHDMKLHSREEEEDTPYNYGLMLEESWPSG